MPIRVIGEIFTTSPVWGEWIIWPPPMYSPTCEIGLLKNTKSPGCSWSSEMRWVAAYCAEDECGRLLPPRAHAYMVRPEQSKPVDGLAPAQR